MGMFYCMYIVLLKNIKKKSIFIGRHCFFKTSFNHFLQVASDVSSSDEEEEEEEEGGGDDDEEKDVEKKQNKGKKNKGMLITHKMIKDWSKAVQVRGRRDRDRIVVGFTTACAIRAYHH